jgi:putative RecB family exonuclease
MPARYSISRLSCFRQCRLQYKFRYIDWVPVKVESIEAFMGSRVHEALQAFYDRVMDGVVEPKPWLEARYLELWTRKAHPDLKVNREDRSIEDYREVGRRCLSDYYDAYHPFDRTKVLRTEELIRFKVSHGGRTYDFCGVLDRLDWNAAEGVFEIHDYKTSSTLPGQEEADRDQQLALYHLAILNDHPEAQAVKLIWHYLAFNEQIESRRSAEQLAALEKDIVAAIEEIEACRAFPPAKGALCAWCGYQPQCPEWTSGPAQGPLFEKG